MKFDFTDLIHGTFNSFWIENHQIGNTCTNIYKTSYLSGSGIEYSVVNKSS
jgi:hypothetical protein